jgi:hypothetical protein
LAKVIARPPTSGLYENEFALWAERQGALLRAKRFDELDLENLIEEVEDLSRRERDTRHGRSALLPEEWPSIPARRTEEPCHGQDGFAIGRCHPL